MQLIGTKGQKFHPCPGTKGQWDKLKILPRDRTGRDSQNSGRDGTAKIRDGTRDKTGLSRKGCSKTGRRCSKTENDVLKQEKDVLKQEKDVLKQEKEVLKQKIWSFYWKFFNSFCPGTSRDRGFCPGTFAPAFVLGQWDTGTRNFFLSRDVPWKPYYCVVRTFDS